MARWMREMLRDMSASDMKDECGATEDSISKPKWSFVSGDLVGISSRAAIGKNASFDCSDRIMPCTKPFSTLSCYCPLQFFRQWAGSWPTIQNERIGCSRLEYDPKTGYWSASAEFAVGSLPSFLRPEPCCISVLWPVICSGNVASASQINHQRHRRVREI